MSFDVGTDRVFKYSSSSSSPVCIDVSNIYNQHHKEGNFEFAERFLLKNDWNKCVRTEMSFLFFFV
jgi:hypothetical protein